MIARIIFCPGPFMHPHLQHIHLWFQHKADSDGACPACPISPSQIITQTSIKSCQMCAIEPPDHKEKLQASCCSNFQKRNDQLAWDVTISAAIQLHCMAMSQWRFYPIRKTCKKWKLTLSSSMAIYSVMRDIHDAMERRWVAFYVTCKCSNQLTLDQWAFENGLPLFWYTLYIVSLLVHIRSKVVCSKIKLIKMKYLMKYMYR